MSALARGVSPLARGAIVFVCVYLRTYLVGRRWVGRPICVPRCHPSGHVVAVELHAAQPGCCGAEVRGEIVLEAPQLSLSCMSEKNGRGAPIICVRHGVRNC